MNREAAKSRWERRHTLLGIIKGDGETTQQVVDLLSLLVISADVAEGFSIQDDIPTLPPPRK